ncbi:MAG: divergent polysaccharide deacetylase family protein, partial [Sneathiella sp.]|nr:divergent polysaccharide deacetylase family protein [Sneathiella sp.]
MFIGGIIKKDGAPVSITTSPREDAQLPQISALKPTEEVSQDGAQEIAETAELITKPIDALAYDPSDYRQAPNGALDPESKLDKLQPDDDIEVAALPPVKIIPKIMPSAQEQTWKKFSIPFPVMSGKPLIAMVIDDVGLNSKRVQALIALPPPLTLSFLPYAKRLDEFSKKTRNQGHEVMLHMPMEPLRASADPGPDALLKALSLDEIRSRTLKNLSQFSGYVGVNNHMGSKFTAYEDGMAVVMDILASEGLLFLDSRTTAKSKGYRLARERGMPTGNRDVFIDNEISLTAINSQLATVEKYARKNGIVIAIGHPYPETIEALSKWIPQAKAKGFQFVPITTALTHKVAKAN